MSKGDLTADTIIAAFDLQPHPEGGWYRETFRDNPDGGRGHATAIYFLLRANEASAWHRIDASETWLYHAGAALDLALSRDGVTQSSLQLGMDLAAGQRPQAVVPARWWQSARTTGSWTFVSCTVAPGFDFAGFELAPPDWCPQEISVSAVRR